MSFLNDCFDTMLEYGEAIKSSFVKGYVSDWPENKEEEIDTPDEPKTEESEVVQPKVSNASESTIEDPVEEESKL